MSAKPLGPALWAVVPSQPAEPMLERASTRRWESRATSSSQPVIQALPRGQMAAAGSSEGAQPLRPPQLRGIDGKGTFTHTSLAVRLPSIVKELAERLRLNAPGVPSGVIDELRRLADRIAADEPLAELKAPFNSDYNQHLRSAVAADAAAAATEEATAAAVLGGTKGEHGSALARGSWLSLPWWLTEHWAYRCILEIVRPRCGDDFDPFQWHKKEATDHALGALRADLPTIAASGKE